MIAISCIRYLDLYYRELDSLQNTAGGSFSSWSSEDIDELARYLDRRPLIKYSLEFLTALKEDMNVHPGVQQPFLGLTTNLKCPNCPSALQICLLGGQTNFNAGTQHVQELNHLLGIAARNGYIVDIGNLLAAGAECSTVLHGASRRGHVTTVRLLLDCGADITVKNPDKRTPLHMAACHGHEVAVGLLLDRGANIEANGSGRWTPLPMAARCEHEAMIGSLLDRGAVIEANDFGKQTLPHMAAREGHEAAIELLLGRGAVIEANDSGKQMLLHMAAREGNEAAIEMLLD